MDAKKGPPPCVTYVTPSLRQSRLTVRLCVTDRVVNPVAKNCKAIAMAGGAKSIAEGGIRPSVRGSGPAQEKRQSGIWLAVLALLVEYFPDIVKLRRTSTFDLE